MHSPPPRRPPQSSSSHNEAFVPIRSSKDHLLVPPLLHLQSSYSTLLPSNSAQPMEKLPIPTRSPLRRPPDLLLHPPISLCSPPSSPMSPRPHAKTLLREERLHQTFQYEAPPHNRLKSHRVGFAEYGALGAGHPAFVIGGHGSSRLLGVMFEELALRYGIRMVWPERPGYGLSDECPPQDVSALEWADVVIQLADHLHIRRFSLIAQSVGTVFALAIAHKYPSRVLGPIYLISPWVSTQAANTFKWTRRLPAPLVTRTLSLAMDMRWIFNRSKPPSTSSDDDSGLHSNSSDSVVSDPGVRSPVSAMLPQEEDELLASLDEDIDLPTDFPANRPLRHFVRPKHVSLYLAMDQLRMSEPNIQGQLIDVLVALEKYHPFGFSYSDIRVSVSAVWGDKDGLIPQRAIDTLANSVRDLRLKILEGECHDLVWKEGVMEWAIRGIAQRRRARPY